jgi:dihydrofolate reductase
MKQKIKIVVAVAENNVIGNNGGLPWHLKKDLAWFEKQTTGNTVVMGRKSYEDIIKYTKNKPLKNRKNIVLTSQKEILEGFIVKNSVEEILNDSYSTDLMIIGGTNIFKAFLPFVDQIVITEIKKEFAGDTYFPKWDKNDFVEIERLPQEENGLFFDFVTYERKK